MVDVSKLVRARMANTPPAGPHPDAGQLTAFVEQSLIARERESVLAHLATCADCREVVTLAAPETASAAAASGAPGKSWFTLPFMRWGAIAAAVALVAL